ncbi:MAG TPA: hypothetical protein VFL66_02025 [Gaiellaceae bacterium]|nr:hypothetical protein [Gaiellaceae bacterium]
MLAAATLAVSLAATAPVPTPIGVGPRFAPPPRVPAACAHGPLRGRYRAHVELFALRRVALLPPGIGIGLPREIRGARVVAGGCRAPARTLDPTGVVEFDRAGLTVGDLFAAWRMPLGVRRLLSFRGAVSAWVDGRRRRGDPRSIPLRDGAEIVLEIGGYVPPHSFYVFPPRGRARRL